MVRLVEGLNNQDILSKEVTISITLEELAYITTILGGLNDIQVRKILNSKLSCIENISSGSYVNDYIQKKRNALPTGEYDVEKYNALLEILNLQL